MAENNPTSEDHSVESPSAAEIRKQKQPVDHETTDNGDQIQIIDSANTKTGPKKEDGKDNGSTDEKSELETKAKDDMVTKAKDDMVTKANDDSINAEETKRLREKLKIIQDKHATHALYCPNCTLDITESVILYEKTKAPPPYDQKTWVRWVPLVFPYSFIWRWYTCIRQGLTAKTSSTKTTKPPVKNNPSPDEAPNPSEGKFDNIPPSDDKTRGWISSSLIKKYLLYLLVTVVLLLLLVIVLWALPSFKGRGHKNPGLPSLPLPSLPLPIHFPVIKYLPVILLILLAVLALAWWLKKVSMPSIPTIPKVPNIDMLWKSMMAPFEILSKVKLDILKSIVYGGLIESITSLGVVSSAAGSGASTLNVLALGIANLFSGLFLISHNFWVLRWRKPYRGENHDHTPNVAPKDQEGEEKEEKDHQYRILLGEKKFAWLHAVVVLVSLVIFAVIPPLLYGFSYKIIDREHSKATIVFVVSLVCVISLSFAKAYAFKMEKKLMTVAEYTGVAIAASVLSFMAGKYFMDAFGKLDLH